VTVLTKKSTGTPTASSGPGGAVASGPAGPSSAGVGPNNVQIPTNMPGMTVDPLSDMNSVTLNPW
jgi:hypothetical protein